jgi:hypothetical protein
MSKILDCFCGMLYVADHFDWDCDDFSQTLILAKSLIDNQGFNHKDLVESYRTNSILSFKDKTLNMCGMDPKGTYFGQIAKLRSSDDPLYISTDGITDGGAMKIMPVVAYFLTSDYLPYYIRAVTRITHNSPQAVLGAILIGLRYKHAFWGINDPKRFLEEFQSIANKMYKDEFFLSIVKKAFLILEQNPSPVDCLYSLAKNIGLAHLSWCCPVSATVWTYALGEDYMDYWLADFNNEQIRSFSVKGRHIDGELLDREVANSYLKIVEELKCGWIERFLRSDVDTFFHLVFSIKAAECGIDRKNLLSLSSSWGNDLVDISYKLGESWPPTL